MPRCNRLRMENLEKVKGDIPNHVYKLFFHVGQQFDVTGYIFLVSKKLTCSQQSRVGTSEYLGKKETL